MLAGGAFAAFLSTASGLTMSVAGVIDQDLLRRRLGRMTGDDFTVVQGFRLATVLAVIVPYAASRLIEPVGLATMVSLAFAVAASTFCPLLVLGVLVARAEHRRRRRRAGRRRRPGRRGRGDHDLRRAHPGLDRRAAGPAGGVDDPASPSPRRSSSRSPPPAGSRGTPRAPWCGCTPPRTWPSTATDRPGAPPLTSANADNRSARRTTVRRSRRRPPGERTPPHGARPRGIPAAQRACSEHSGDDRGTGPRHHWRCPREQRRSHGARPVSSTLQDVRGVRGRSGPGSAGSSSP